MKSLVAPMTVVLAGFLSTGFVSGCVSLPAMKLYEGELRPIQEVATLTWYLNLHVRFSGYIDSIDGKRLKDCQYFGKGHLLPGEHHLVLGYGPRDAFTRSLANLGKRIEYPLTAHLEAGKHYNLDFRIENTHRVLKGNDELKYVLEGTFVRLVSGTEYEAEFWPIDGRPEAMPDSMYPLRFEGLCWEPVIEEVPLVYKDGMWPDSWFNAAYRGNLEHVRACLARGDEVNRQDASGMTALYVASWKGRTKIVRLLLKHGAEVDVAHKSGVTPLWKAAQNGHTEIVGLLLDAGANVDPAPPDGSTALREAAFKGYYDIVILLLQHKADVNATHSNGTTALWMAALSGHMDIIKALIEAGANVNVENAHGATPLYLAAEAGRIDIVRALVEAGANLNAKASNGHTALSLAKQKGYRRITGLLTKYGATK